MDQNEKPQIPWNLYDWKIKIDLRVLGQNDDGLTVLDPRTDQKRWIRWDQSGIGKRYRPS
jgi:hypothetical protein